MFMDRHFLLATLYSGIEEKRRVVLNKKVSKVEHTLKGVSVECTDGSAYHGAIVVGADGVYSIVRNEMWRNIDIARPGFLSDTLRSGKFGDSCISPATDIGQQCTPNINACLGCPSNHRLRSRLVQPGLGRKHILPAQLG